MKYEWGYFEGIYNTHIYFMELIKHLLMGIAIQQSNVARGKSSMNGSFNLGKFIEINGGFFSKPGLMAPEGSTYSEEMPHWGIVINN